MIENGAPRAQGRPLDRPETLPLPPSTGKVADLPSTQADKVCPSGVRASPLRDLMALRMPFSHLTPTFVCSRSVTCVMDRH